MAYQDPYSSNYNYNNAGYSNSQYPQDQPAASYPPYDSGAYNSETNTSRPMYGRGDSSSTGLEKRRTRFSMGEPPKDTGELRLWRHDEHGDLWVKGGRGSCLLRFCCCSIMTTLFLVVAIALSFAMWLRPPDISFGSISPPTSGSAIEATTDGLKINMALPISVKNPNFFTASFEKISAKAYYPLGNVEMGGGSKDNIAFASNSDTTFNFPFSLDYTRAKDPTGSILMDISDRCGFSGNARKKIEVKYTITLQIKIVTFSISPSFTGSTGFDCPLTQDQVEPFLRSINGGTS
ncbi:hypothetical protein CPB86DRAFT_862212 [Serendipita vermifera]|nr:hypothetical protein CPB86DRAFT_862212 [Serendipita vermifera]